MTSATTSWPCWPPVDTNIDDVERVAGGKTFFWKGRYHEDMNTRDTLDTQLNVFEHFDPKLSAGSRPPTCCSWPTSSPACSSRSASSATRAFVALDSMNLWIDIARDELVEIIGKVDCLILNDEELRQLTGKPNLFTAAREILGLGHPSIIVAKQGEYGSALITAGRLLRAARLSAGAGRRSDRGGRHLRRRLRRAIANQIDAPLDGDTAAQRDGLRHRAGLVQRRAVRHRGA